MFEKTVINSHHASEKQLRNELAIISFFYIYYNFIIRLQIPFLYISP